MVDFLIDLASILIGYLVGSVSFSRIVTGLVSPEADLQGTPAPVEGTDEKLHMSGISATSVRLRLGPRYGLLVSFLDMVKVAVPVGAFRFFFPDLPAHIFAAAAGLIGHNWPLYYKFNGGYGHSAIYGALLVIEWTAIPINLLGTAVFYFIFRQVHYALLGGVLLLIPWLWYLGYDTYTLLYAGLCSAAYFKRILPDLRAYRQIVSRKSKTTEVGTERE